MNKVEQYKLNNNPEGFNVKHYSFPSIGQYRNAIRNIKDTTRYSGKDENGAAIFDASIPLPKLKYLITTKLHGTNSAIGFFVKNNEIHQTYQSRERLLSITSDNAGFCTKQMSIFHNNIDNVIKLFNTLEIELENDKIYHIFGEWIGAGIQKKVAICELPKMMVIFAIKVTDINNVDNFTWLNRETISKGTLPDLGIHNIFEAPSIEIDIDFNEPELKQNEIVDITLAIEKECPFAKVFGVSGLGEGCVLIPIDEKYRNNSGNWFKSKGELHQSSTVKTLNNVDIEKVNSVKEFVDKVCTVSRLDQGIDKMRENNLSMDRKNIGFYLKWVTTDVFKEELDTLLESGLTTKDVGGAISNKAKEYFFEKEKEF